MSGNDIKQKGVVINLDKERHLIFDLNAFCELEERYGSMENAINEMQKGSMKAIRYLLYLGLLNEDENLTEKEVGSLITIKNLNQVMNSIALGIQISSPNSDEKK